MSKVLAIIQARMGSTRLPGKVLKKVKDKTLLEYEIDRVKKAKLINKIVVATTDLPEDGVIEELCQTIGVDFFRGSADDVLDRYFQCAEAYPDYETIVRITGDCPLIDPQVIDQVVNYFLDQGLDYASNVEVETYPDGMDLEVMKKDVLSRSAAEARLASEREHVTLHIRQNLNYRKGNVANDKNFSAFHVAQSKQHQLKTFIQVDPETGHLFVCDINLLLCRIFQ